MNSRQRRALRYREACKKQHRQLSQATGCPHRVQKALALPPQSRE